MLQVEPLHIAIVGQPAVVFLTGPPPVRGQGPVVPRAETAVADIGIIEGIVEVEAKVCVIAPVQLVAAGSVRFGHDAPVPGELPGLFQQEGEVRPLLHVRAVAGVAVRPPFQAAPHDQVEVEAVQLPPLLEPGFRQALPGGRISVGALPDLFRPEGHQLLHKSAELFLAELPVSVRNQPLKRPVAPLHVA